MKKYKRLLFIGVLFLLLPNTVNAIVLCGDTLSESEEFSWTSFRDGRGAKYISERDTDEMYLELRELLRENSSNWTLSIRKKAINQMNELIAGVATSGDFSLGKDVGPGNVRQYIFGYSENEIELPYDGTDKKCDKKRVKKSLIEVAQFSQLVYRAVQEIEKQYWVEYAKNFKRLERQFDKYLFEGFPMFPWEAGVNSWFLTDKNIANGPPPDQLVLMHFAAGVVMASGSDTDIGGVLSVEPIGWVHYSKDYETWYGISILADFPTDRNVGIGVGLNYNTFKIGVTWHNDDEYDDPMFFVGLDLYAFVSDKYKKYTSYKEKSKRLLMEVLK